MTWHPPIPAGLTTEPAVRRLKAGLHLLIYCYDCVDREGRVHINLKAIAAEIETPYDTVRNWWNDLREGPFFTDIQDCGRKGFTAQFNAEWLDWHVMKRNYGTAERSNLTVEANEAARSINPERSNLTVEEPIETPEDTLNGISIGSSIGFQRSKTPVEDSAYKVLSNDQESTPPPNGGGGITRARETQPIPTEPPPPPRDAAALLEETEHSRRETTSNAQQQPEAPTPRSARPPSPELPSSIALAAREWLKPNGELNRVEREHLLNLFGMYKANWIELAIQEAMRRGGRAVNYLDPILADWNAVGEPKLGPKHRGKTNGTHQTNGLGARTGYQPASAEDYEQLKQRPKRSSANVPDVPRRGFARANGPGRERAPDGD